MLSLVLCAACSSAGPYGYAPTYTPLDEEETAAEGAKEFDPVMAKRFPEEWRDKPVSRRSRRARDRRARRQARLLRLRLQPGGFPSTFSDLVTNSS